MTGLKKKEIVDVFIVCLVAMACPLLIPVAINVLDTECGDKK